MPGTQVEVDGKCYLIGDINPNKGTCDDCVAFDSEAIVTRYRVLLPPEVSLGCAVDPPRCSMCQDETASPKVKCSRCTDQGGCPACPACGLCMCLACTQQPGLTADCPLARRA